MKIRKIALSAAALILTASAPAHAGSSFKCEALFSAKSSLDTLIAGTDGLFPQMTRVMLASKNAQAPVKVLYGTIGGSVETFEEVIDLSKEKLEGLEVRNSSRPDEGQTLNLHVRLRASMNDIWKVSLASEMDGLVFLISSKENMKQQLVDSFEANGFVVKAASAAISPVTTSVLPSEVKIGEDYKLVGIETAVTRDHHKDSVLVLKLENSKTAEVIEVKSARTAQGRKVARQLLASGKATITLQGTSFVLKENLNPGRLAPRSSAL